MDNGIGRTQGKAPPPIHRGVSVQPGVLRRAAAVMLACGVTHVVADRLIRWVADPVALARLSRPDRVYLPEK